MTIHIQRPPAWAALAFGALLCAAPARAQDRPVATRLPVPQPAQSSIDVPTIKYTQFTLRNGLRVILHEDHSSPIVAIEVWYNVGSKHDPKGKSGLAHMFEHMLDEGTLNMKPGEYRRIIQSDGGDYNAMTSNDWTRYYMTVPSNKMDIGLWLEAERMANLSPALDSGRFNLEREAVRNEYRSQILSSAPNSTAEATIENLFAGGAYGVPVIGYMSELAGATVDDLRRFYETFYVPNNAVLVVAGDITPADARKKVEAYFSPIPRGKPVVHPKTVVPLQGEKRFVVEHPAGMRQLWAVWRGASSTSADRPAAVALSSILTDRLRRLLVTERRLATSLPPYNLNFDLRDAGLLQVAVTLSATGSATEVERLVDSVVASIRTDGVTEAEVQRWIGTFRLGSLTAMQGIRTKAQFLGDGLTIMNNPLGNFSIAQRAAAVRPADVLAAARKYLTGDRVVMSLVPAGKPELRSRPELPYVNASRKGS